MSSDVGPIFFARHEISPSARIRRARPVSEHDKVRISEGTFENFEGDVVAVDESTGRVTVEINIFGRATPLELESWQVEPT